MRALLAPTRRWPLGLTLLSVVLIVTLSAFAFTFTRLNSVASLSSVSITGWAYAEFVRQAAEVRVTLSDPQRTTPQDLDLSLAVLQSKATVVSGEPLLDRIDPERRAALLRAVDDAQQLTIQDLRAAGTGERLDRIIAGAQEGYAGAVDLLGRERSGIARSLHIAEVTLGALAALLALTITTVILQIQWRAQRDVRLESERRSESERARAALERTASELRAAEHALQRERDFAVQVMEAVGEGLYVTGPTGQFEYVNPALARMVGQPAALLVQRPSAQVLPDVPDPPPGRGPLTTEYALRRPDGGVTPTLLTTVPRQGGGVTAVLTDLSAPKQTEARLRALYEVTARSAADTVLQDLLSVASHAFNAPGAFVQNGAVVARAGAIDDRTALHLAEQNEPHGPGHLRVPVRGAGHAGALVFSGAPFTSADEDFLRLIGQWLEQDAAREQTARQLRRSEELNKAVIRSALDGIITCDEQGVITEFNPAAEHMFGHARSLALGRTLDQLFRPAAVPADPSPLPLTGPHSVLGQRLERQAQRRDGTPFLVELSVVHLPTERPEYAAFLRDITERRAAEHRLQQRTAQLDSVFNVSPDGFVIFDGAGHVIEVNPAFLALTGTRLHDLLHQTEATFEQVLRSRCVAARPGGLTGPDVIQVAQPIRRVLKRTRRAMGGSGLGSVMYFRDITHEAEISSMKSEFMSTAAHELRTPMTSIYGFTELLLTRTLDAETTRDLLDTIYRQAGQLLNLLTELLDLARIEARTGQDFIIQPEPVRPLIENTARAFTPPAEQGRVRLAVTPNLPLLPVDAAKFNQALGNVLSNAFKYAPSGPITVRAALTPDHTALQVTVQDHGIGMTPEQTHRAFERFYRADNSGNVPGTGLGLSLVQEIMWGHHGEATLESAAGHGTTVTLTFPTTPLPPPQEFAYAQENPDRG